MDETIKIVSKDEAFYTDAIERTEKELKRLELEQLAQMRILEFCRVKLDNLKGN